MSNPIDRLRKNVPPDSPLSTRELRDSLARRPLSHYKTNSRPECSLEDISKQSESNNEDSSPTATLTKQRTSSPVNDGGQWSSPHLSMIRTGKSPEDQSPTSIGDHLKDTQSRNKTQSSESLSNAGETDVDSTSKVPLTTTSERKQSRGSKMTRSVDKSFLKCLEKDLRACEAKGYQKSQVLLFVLVLLISLGLGYFVGSRTLLAHQSVHLETILRERMSEMRAKQFPSQEKRLWRVLRSSFLKILRRNETIPTCLLLTASQEADLTVKHLSVEISNLFLTMINSTARVIPLNGGKLAKMNDLEAGHQLFDYLESNLNDKRVALVHDIGKLNGKVAINFHPFCDESRERAIFPGSIVLLSVFNSDPFVMKRSAEWIADISLRRAWEPAIGPDKVASLISRVAKSVVEVRPEENVHVVELL